jgi:hypothetical protein
MKTVYVLIGVFYDETGRDAWDTILVTTDPELVIPERERARALDIYDNIIFEEHSLVEPAEEVA